MLRIFLSTQATKITFNNNLKQWCDVCSSYSTFYTLTSKALVLHSVQIKGFVCSVFLILTIEFTLTHFIFMKYSSHEKFKCQNLATVGTLLFLLLWFIDHFGPQQCKHMDSKLKTSKKKRKKRSSFLI